MTSPEPTRVASPSGLTVQVNANGSIHRIDHNDVILNLYLGTEVEGGVANLFLRRLGESISWVPLLGPRSPGRVLCDEAGLDVEGKWNGVAFHVALRLAESAPAWFWHVSLANLSQTAATVDLVYAQDLALAHYGALRLNEYYVSQYVDHTPLDHASHGVAVASRQNLSVGGRHPWTVIGSLARSTSFATDALDLHGLGTRAGRSPVPEALALPRLAGERRQHEHSLVAIQDESCILEAGARVTRGFFGWLDPDHAEATGAGDLSFVDRALALPEAGPTIARAVANGADGTSSATLFGSRPLLAATELDETEIARHFGGERRAVETRDGRLLSFFRGASAHVVLPAKEHASLKPHGQILRTGERLVPDEAALTSTVWMGGVFHSMITEGHVSINRFLSTNHSYLGLFRSYGLRIFVELADGWQLLDQPSAFEMEPSGARWIYRHEGGSVEVRSWAAVERHELWLTARVVTGDPGRFLVSCHVALNGDDGAVATPVRFSADQAGITVGVVPDTDVGRRFPEGSFRIDLAPGTTLERVGGDELLFEDGRSRNQPFLVMVTARAPSMGLRITGRLLGDSAAAESIPDASEQAPVDSASADRFWNRMATPLAVSGSSAGSAAGEAARVQEILPWLAHDASIHYLAPRGLEQYSGGGWGTRDVTQGPVEWLLALGSFEPVRDILVRVFQNQNADGDWPQWFMFFERERNIRPGDSHGDIVFWPLLALGQYLLASDDFAVLDEVLPFFHPEGGDQPDEATVVDHVERALRVIDGRLIPGTRLVSYGHGDWNDSLQPVDSEVAARLCSAWTVTLHHQTFATLAAALERAGRTALAERMTTALPGIHEDFQRWLVPDGVVAGFAHFRPDGSVGHVIHPNDSDTGVRFSLLPMIHAILADLLSREQVDRHVEVIRRELLASDGARLFDRPFPYRGGPERQFQRAESSSFFGREIGIMYTHAHLRYAEAMAHLGETEAFFLALRQVNPVGLRDVVRNARLRQANCYTSSSDADFRDRYDALARYDCVRTGEVAVEGGWRVYSSGAGIAFRLIREHLLGLRLGRSQLGIDPVLPRAFDGLRATVELAGQQVDVIYSVGPLGHGPKTVSLNGASLPVERCANPWRTGGVTVPMGALREGLVERDNVLVVELG